LADFSNRGALEIKPVSPSKAYYNIRVARSSTRTIRAAGGQSIPYDSIGNFDKNDEKFSVPVKYRHNYSAKQNLSSSLELQDFHCYTCMGEGHWVLHREGEQIDIRELTPVAFVLSDQNFPASLPVEDCGGECMKIIRVEDGTLLELVAVLLEATRGFVVPAGSVVVIASASHLAWVGAAAYAREYTVAQHRLRAAFRGGIEVVHGVPLLASGVPDCNGAWAILDFFTWLGHIHTGQDITHSHITLTNTAALLNQPGLPLAPAVNAGLSLTLVTASLLAAVSYNLSMPADLDKKESDVFEMRHVVTQEQDIKPFDLTICNNLITTLIEDLNKNFMTDLETSSVAEPLAVTEDTGTDTDTETYPGVKFIFVGGSHAARLAAAADNAGWETKNLSMPGFCVTPDSIENAAILLQEAIEEDDGLRKIVIFQLYDNNCYFSCLEDGSKSLPVRDKSDNKYHIPGRLAVADHVIIKNLINISVPLLRAAGDYEKVVVTSLPRYLKKCCSNKEHLTNRREPGFKKMLEECLAEVKKSMQELIHGKKIRSFCVLSPQDLLADRNEDREEVKFWDSDPVPLIPEGYTELLAAIASAATAGDYEWSRIMNPSPAPAQKPAKVYHRQKWISSDDVTAHCVYNQPRGQSFRVRGFPSHRAHARRGDPSKMRGRGPHGRGRRHHYRPY
jgi:hypothetical protein